MLPAFVLALSGCGLESFILLSPPTGLNVGDSLNNKFEFSASSNNNEIQFLGFEVYYRIYLISETPINYYSTFDDLIAAAYHRLNDPGDTPGNVNEPLVFVDLADRGDYFVVTIDFQVTSTVYPKLTATGAAINGPDTTVLIDQLRRSVVKTTPSEFKQFTEFAAEDIPPATGSDISQSLFDEISTPLPIQLVFFAVSYGNDVGLRVYSQPEWLGNKIITFPYP